jgi:hypothetical protein
LSSWYFAGDAERPSTRNDLPTSRFWRSRWNRICGTRLPRIAHGQTAETPDAVDLVEDPLSNDAWEDVNARATAMQTRPLLPTLPERERDSLERRANEETLRTVARSLDLSHLRVGDLGERALPVSGTC